MAEQVRVPSEGPVSERLLGALGSAAGLQPPSPLNFLVLRAECSLIIFSSGSGAEMAPGWWGRGDSRAEGEPQPCHVQRAGPGFEQGPGAVLSAPLGGL